jgi:type I restriction enzyme S subunit
VKGREIGSSKRLVENGTVLVCKINPRINRTWVIRGHSPHRKVASTEWIPFSPVEGLIPEYLSYYMRQESFRQHLATNVSGVGGSLMRVRPKAVHDYPFVHPAEEEQRDIVAKIDELFSDLDAGVAALKRAQANLKRYRAAVLKAAVEGKLTEQWRAENPPSEPASVLLERILAARRKKWEEEQLKKYEAKGKMPPKNWREKYKVPELPDPDDLPAIPRGWCWVTVDHICKVIADCTHSTPKWAEKGKMCVRTTEFRPGRLVLDGVRYVTEETFVHRIARVSPEPGDILYSREGGILGIACMIPDGVTVCMGQRMMLMRPVVKNAYLMHVLNSPLIVSHVNRLTGGSASPHLNVRDIVRFPIPLPPLDEQATLLAEIDRRMSVADNEEASTADDVVKATVLRRAILKRAFEGRLLSGRECHENRLRSTPRSPRSFPDQVELSLR